MVLIIEVNSFTFSAATVTVDNLQINAIATYTISLMRSYDDSLNPTDWNLTTVPSTATVTVTFPSQFTSAQLSGYSCVSVMVNIIDVTGYTCALSNNTLVISHVFTGSDLVSEVDITLGNIVNPFSAVTTNPFIGTMNTDTSSSSSAAEVTYLSNPLTSLNIYFQSGIVNRTSDLILNLVIADMIPASGLITISFPAALIWAR
jgi:hypothetical protein